MRNPNEEPIVQDLAEIPPVPDSIYPAVMAHIGRRNRIVRMAWALAATLVLAVGITTYTVTSKPPAPVVADAATTQATNEINDELQIVYDYVNGNSIEEEINQYALVDPSLF